MLNLIKKELCLCLHPTCYIFLALSALVFVPNYPYEVVFFFSTLSTFFVCITSRENDDLAFSCALPIKKADVPVSRILVIMGLQVVMMSLVLVFGFLKCAFMKDMLLNEAGISANLTLVGNGALMLGVFNIAFFPLYYRNPKNVGAPFVLGAICLFMLLMVFIVLRHVTNLYGVILNGDNAEYTLEKLLALLIGLAIYAILTSISVILSRRNFQKIDL